MDHLKYLRKSMTTLTRSRLPGDYQVSSTFNVADLSPYYSEHFEELQQPDFEAKSFQSWENDASAMLIHNKHTITMNEIKNIQVTVTNFDNPDFSTKLVTLIN